MNVTFHTVAALATAAVLSSRNVAQSPDESISRSRAAPLGIGFLIGLILHGVFDFYPHAYTFNSGLDILFSLILFFSALALAKRQHMMLIGACFIGAAFPDLVEGPPVLNKHLGWSVPLVKVFPWHWRQYSGSIYDGSKGFESLLGHVAVVGLAISLLYVYRYEFFARARPRPASSWWL